MTTHLVTFSDESMSRAMKLCRDSAFANGVEQCWPYGPESLRTYPEYDGKQDWFGKRGCGYWLFKPVIINRVLTQLIEGNILIYADAGIEFIAPVQHIIDRMDQDIFLFGNNWEHAHWCKRDVVASVWPASWNLDGNKPHYSYPVPNGAIAYDKLDGGVSWAMFGKQAQASVIFFRVSDYSRAFVAEWLKWCLFDGGRLIDDSPSRAPNHPEFREHRHDQSILTTLSYREGIKLHYWPAMYNDGAFTYEKLPEYASDDYPILFHHHRRRDHEWSNMA